MLKINLPNTGMSGLARTILRDSKGSIKFDSGFHSNLLLNSFFALNPNSNFTGFCAVGTGTTAPLPTDTDIGSILGSRTGFSGSSGQAQVSGDDAIGYTWTSSSRIYRFDLGAIVGNISEFALSTNDAPNTAVVKNLIKDINGNPTAISVTADDQLEIWWALSKHCPGSNDMSDVVTTVTLNGVATDVTLKQFNPSWYATNISNVISPKLFDAPSIKTVISTTADALKLVNSVSGENLSGTSTSEQSVSTISPTTDTSVIGQVTYSISATFGLNPGGSDVPMQAVVLTTNTTSTVSLPIVLASMAFSPQFNKSSDKVLTVSFSYTVSRL